MPSSGSSDCLSAADMTMTDPCVASAQVDSDHSVASYYSVASNAEPTITDEPSSGDQYSRGVSEVRSGFPSERPQRSLSLLQRCVSQRVRPQRTVRTYVSRGKPKVTVDKLPRR